MQKIILVLTNVPNYDTATHMAKHLIESKLAACVNVLNPCTSIYHWQGKTESTEETPMLIKSTEQAYPAIEATIRSLHPYELPEIICVPVTDGFPAYLQWVAAETQL